MRAKDNEELKENVVTTVIKNGPKEASLRTENATIYVNKFNNNDAEQDLDWATGFWKMQREAIPTRNPNKCRSCEYSTVCDANR